MVDLYPGASASAMAVNNLARCGIGAAGVAVVQFVVDAVGEGLAFVWFSGIVVACCPLLAAEWVWGEKWRGDSGAGGGLSASKGRERGRGKRGGCLKRRMANHDIPTRDFDGGLLVLVFVAHSRLGGMVKLCWTRRR